METMLGSRSRFLDMLFVEDFDSEPEPPAPEQPPEPRIIEPQFTASDVAMARDEAWSEGRQAGVAEANAGHVAALARAMTSVAAVLADTRAGLTELAERTGDGLARALMGSMAAMLPALCRDHGEGEVRAVLKVVLPGLMREPAITIRVHPRLSDAVRSELSILDPVVMPSVSIVPTDAIAFGDVRVDWEDGTARRDAGAIWRGVHDILLGGDLLAAQDTAHELVHAG